MDLIIRNIDDHLLGLVIARAILFRDEFPDRKGFRNGAVYGRDAQAMYVYRTSTGKIVVRGIDG